MESGELEHRQAFESTTTQNVKMVVEYTKTTRDLVRVSELKIKELEKEIISLHKLISDLRNHLAKVQSELYKGGTS